MELQRKSDFLTRLEFPEIVKLLKNCPPGLKLKSADDVKND